MLEAQGGKAGIRLAHEAKPKLIILDLVMPDLSAFEVLHILKGDPATCEIPVVIHTSQQLGQGDRALLGAAVDIVIKDPTSRELIGLRMTEAMSRAGLASGAN